MSLAEHHVLMIVNDPDHPGDIIETNYYDLWMGQQGLVYLTFNAGAARLLIPDSMAAEIPAMTRGVDMVIMTSGLLDDDPEKPGVELLFEDHSTTPLTLHFLTSQCDRADMSVSPEDAKKARQITLWTRAGKQWEGVLRMRQALSLPCLQGWIEP